MRHRFLNSLALAASLAAVGVPASGSPARAAVTIGQLASAPSMTACSGAATDRVQPTVTSGNTYVVPAVGTITSWSHNFADADQSLTMKVFRQVAGLTYMVVGHDGPRPLTEGALNTFTASVPVKPGDVLGLNSASSGINACPFLFAPGEQHLSRTGNLADGEPETFGTSLDRRLNIAAVVEPTNTFSIGKAKRNNKKGTATITLTIPNPGTLTGSGNGVKRASAGRAMTSKSISAGQAQLLIKAKGKKKRKLNETGKVKLNVAITYTPTGGSPNTQSVKVKLKKKL